MKVAEDEACSAFARMVVSSMDGMVTVAAVTDGKPQAVRTDDAASIDEFCVRVREFGATLQAIGVRDGQPRTVFLEDGAAPNTARIVG